MILRDNTLDMQHALVAAHVIPQLARSFAHVTHAMKHILFDPRVHRTWSLSARLVMVSSAVAGTQIPAMASSSDFNSSVENEADKAEKTRRHRDFSKFFRSDSAPPRFATLLGIFSSVSYSGADFASRKHRTHHDQSTHPDKKDSDPLADLTQHAKRLAREVVAPFAPVLNRALVRASKTINEVRTFLSNTSTILQVTKRAVLGIAALIGRAATYVTAKLIEPCMKGLRLLLSPVSALRWLLTTGAPLIVSWFMESLAVIGRFVALFGELSLGWYGVIAAGLAVAGYEPYRHWDAAKRLLSRWIESAHRAVAHLMKWMADTTRSAAAYAGSPITSIIATLPNALHRLAATAGTTRGMNSARAVERDVALARPAPMLRAVRRAAAAAAFATPLMLAGTPAGAFAPPLVSANDMARLAAPLSGAPMTQDAIVVNYAPNVTIHSEDAADTAALKRRVMDILERHGRELHQVLQREIVRQQRRDFQPRYSNEQR